MTSSGLSATTSPVPGQVNDVERSVPEFETVQNRSRDVADSGTG